MKKVKSNVTQDFNTKRGLRMYADGGLVGTAATGLRNRHNQIDAAVNGAPTAQPAVATKPVAPAPAPAPAKPIEKPARVFGVPIGGPVGSALRKLGMKDGGEVKGPGGPRDDKVPAKGPQGERVQLSNGEYVLPWETVDALGGAEELDELVRETTGREPGPKVIGGVPHAAAGWGLKKALGNTDVVEATAADFEAAGGTKPAKPATPVQSAAPSNLGSRYEAWRNKATSALRRGIDVAGPKVREVVGDLRGAASVGAEDGAAAGRAAAANVGGRVGPALGAVQGAVEKIPGVAPSVKGVTVADATLNDFAKARAASDPAYQDVTQRAAANRARMPGSIASSTQTVAPGGGGGTPPSPPGGGGGGGGKPPVGGAPKWYQPSGFGAKASTKLVGAAGKLGAPLAIGSAIPATADMDVDAQARNMGVTLDRDNSAWDMAKEFYVRGAGALRNIASNASFGLVDQAPRLNPPEGAQPAGPALAAAGPAGANPDVRRALIDMGVDDPSRPPVPQNMRGDILRSARPDPGAYINFGNYGGNADVYGTASRPGGRVNNFAASGGPGNGPGYDMQRNLESMARANAIRQSMIDSQPQGSPSEFRDTSAAAETDAFGKTAAQRQEESDDYNLRLAMTRAGSGPIPAGLRAQQTAMLNNKSEEKRNALDNQTRTRGQDLSYDLGLRGDRTQQRGQNMTYDLGMRRDDTERYGVDSVAGSNRARLRLDAAKANMETGDRRATVMRDELKDFVGLNVKDGNTAENQERFNRIYRTAAATVGKNGIDLSQLDPNIRTEIYKLADRKEKIDGENAALINQLLESVGVRGRSFRSDNVLDYEPNRFERGRFGDTYYSNTGEQSYQQVVGDGTDKAGPSWQVWTGQTPSLEGARRADRLQQEERERILRNGGR
jgi:hypothetical protein